jgi:hypothetical protein
MPARGGNAALSNAELRAAVDCMVAQSKQAPVPAKLPKFG